MIETLSIDGHGFSVSRSYETGRDLLTAIDSKYNSGSLTRYDYTYNNRYQRQTARQSGSAFPDYGNSTYTRYTYNDRGELTDAPSYLGTDVTSTAAPLPGRQHNYDYDSIGNRKSTNRTGNSALKESYFGDNTGTTEGGNSLNQLRSKDNDTLPVQGTVDSATTTVAVLGLTTAPARQGRYWAAELPVSNGSGPWAGNVNVYAAKPGGGTGGADLIRTEPTRAAQLAKALQVFSYDDDGNLSGDGLWDYQYDAENRLVRMATTALAVTAGYPNKILQFRYDYMGRRVMKRDDSVAGTERRYLYAGWNVIAETDASSAVKRTFTWGLDLVGSLTASGGVGALVQIRDWAQQKTLLPTYDGNGNVASLVNDDGTLAAIYEYDPSGQLLRCEGSYAKDNPFRFSTKWQDEETGLVYYGHRYYSPSMGRFLNRDPIAEAGGLNLYGFCGNDGINRWDYLGQSWFSKTWKKLKTWIYKHPIAATVLSALVPGGILLQPWVLHSQAKQAWKYAKRNPRVAAVVAAIATWYIGGWGATALGWSQTAVTVTAGASAGFGGGFVGARASGASLSDSFRAGYQGAAWGGGLALVGSAVFKINPPTSFGWGDAASQYMNAEARYQVGRFAERQWGIDGWAFNAYLTAASFLGNGLFGDRIQKGVDAETGTKFKWISGILSRNLENATLFSKNATLNRIFAFPFDVVDIILGYQGLPSATGWKIVGSDSLRAEITKSHSLGTLDMKTQTLLGTLKNGLMFSLPFGNVAPTGVLLTLGRNDPVSGFFLGKLLNPGATTIPLPTEFLGMAHTNYPGTGF